MHRQHEDVGNALVALVLEVVLGQPQRVVAQRIHLLRHGLGLLRQGLGLAFQRVFKHFVDPFHRMNLQTILDFVRYLR